MRIYVVLWQDRHREPEMMVYHDEQRALDMARAVLPQIDIETEDHVSVYEVNDAGVARTIATAWQGERPALETYLKYFPEAERDPYSDWGD